MAAASKRCQFKGHTLNSSDRESRLGRFCTRCCETLAPSPPWPSNTPKKLTFSPPRYSVATWLSCMTYARHDAHARLYAEWCQALWQRWSLTNPAIIDLLGLIVLGAEHYTETCASSCGSCGIQYFMNGVIRTMWPEYGSWRYMALSLPDLVWLAHRDLPLPWSSWHTGPRVSAEKHNRYSSWQSMKVDRVMDLT